METLTTSIILTQRRLSQSTSGSSHTDDLILTKFWARTKIFRAELSSLTRRTHWLDLHIHTTPKDLQTTTTCQEIFSSELFSESVNVTLTRMLGHVGYRICTKGTPKLQADSIRKLGDPSMMNMSSYSNVVIMGNVIDSVVLLEGETLAIAVQPSHVQGCYSFAPTSTYSKWITHHVSSNSIYNANCFCMMSIQQAIRKS